MCESSSSIKLNKYQLKRNNWTDQDEVHINKWTRLSEPGSNELNFYRKQLEQAKKETSILSTVNEALIGQPNIKVDVSSQNTFQGPEEAEMTLIRLQRESHTNCPASWYVNITEPTTSL